MRVASQKKKKNTINCTAFIYLFLAWGLHHREREKKKNAFCINLSSTVLLTVFYVCLRSCYDLLLYSLVQLV